jgi:hypothetical protein
MLFILRGKNISSVAYVHVRLVLHPGGQSSILLLTKKFFATLYIIPMASYNIPKQSQMTIIYQLHFTFDTCIKSSLTPISLYGHCHKNTLPIRLLIHQEPLQRI